MTPTPPHPPPSLQCLERSGACAAELDAAAEGALKGLGGRPEEGLALLQAHLQCYRRRAFTAAQVRAYVHAYDSMHACMHA
jgi:hypothetical protein